MNSQHIRTTITLPPELVEAADRAIHEGRARSRNELFVTALRNELAAQERARIDAAFAALADDNEFQAESLQFAEESAQGSWEAFQGGEASL
jgi:metal-responsive CopG/Arc/MetJ family transcriptional regulator